MGKCSECGAGLTTREQSKENPEVYQCWNCGISNVVAEEGVRC